LLLAQLEAPNRNHDEQSLDASGIDNVLATLTIGLTPQRTTSGNAAVAAAAAHAAPLLHANGSGSPHVTLKVFEAQRLPLLKVERPDLKQSQHRELIRKEWQRSMLNPANAGK